MKRGIQFFFIAFALLAIAGIAVPKFRANDYRGRIQDAMEQGLGRKVTFGEVRYNLLTGPGFTISDVAIGEDPAIGSEPIAYVVHVEATPRLLSLFTGRLEFSSLRLEDAQLNFSRTQPEAGRYSWNFERLLRPSIIAAFPKIAIRNGRINFEADHVKSVVYLLNADLDITPPSSAGDAWRVRFEGKPARTDRPARGSGSFTAKGNWKPATGKLDLNLQLDRSELSDLVALIRGEDIGLQGAVSGKAHLSGPPSALAIHGRLNVAALHGWEQSVPQGESWPLDIGGLWNVSSQTLKLDGNVAGKVAAHYLMENYFSTPRWGATLTFQDFSVEPLVKIAQHLGAPLPEGLKVAGQLDGAVGYSNSSAGNWEGRATLKKGSLTVPGSLPVQLAAAEVLITNGQAHLQPATAVFPGGDSAEFSGQYTLGAAAPDFTISTEGLNVQAVAGIPLLTGLRAGRWVGQLKYAQKEWSGNFILKAAEVVFAGLSEPIHIEGAEGRIDGARVTLQRMRAHVGKVIAEGEYRYEDGAARPHRFRLGIPELDLAELEKLAMPTLSRKQGLFGFGKPTPPDWLKLLRADGTLQVRRLHAGDIETENFRSRVLWDGVRVSFPNAKAEYEEGQVASRVVVDLSGKAPTYEAATQFTGITWKTGTMDADTVMETSGLGPATLTHLKTSGSFTAHGVMDGYETVSGKFEAPGLAAGPRFTIADLKLTSGRDIAQGKAVLQDDGTLLIETANGARQRMALK